MGGQSRPEPWLRGPITGVPAHLQPLFHSFAQIREDLEGLVKPVPEDRVWAERPGGSLGFHLRHLAGSIDRLTTYLTEGELQEEQLQELREERAGSGTLDELVERVKRRTQAAEELIMEIPASRLFDARTVGRERLPSSVFGLLVHLAEHSQRHLGQIITLAHQLRSG